jgi:hypothetical protein
MIKAITYQIVIKLVSEIFELILPRLSKHIRELLVFYINNLYEKAKATDNIFDDFAVELLARILQIELKTDKEDKKIKEQSSLNYEDVGVEH